jgi:hypothetical protein
MPAGHDGTASNGVGPSAARDARLAVMRHAAASHSTLAGLLAARPSPAVLGEERMRELQDQLRHGGPKQPRWAADAQPIHASPVRLSLPGVRCTEAWVVASIFRTELRAVEEDHVGAVGMLGAELQRARAEAAAADQESRRREGALQEQLALSTHECWAAREEVQTAQRVTVELQVHGTPQAPPAVSVRSVPTTASPAALRACIVEICFALFCSQAEARVHESACRLAEDRAPLFSLPPLLWL